MSLLTSMLLLVAAAPTSTVAAQPAPISNDALVDLFVFDDNAPLSGVVLKISGDALGVTDETGGLSVSIPSGRERLQLIGEGSTIVDLDLLTDAREVLQIIVTLQEGQPPGLDIESSGQRPPFAQDRLTKTATKSAIKKKLPPGAFVGTVRSVEEDRPVKNARLFFSGTDVEVRTDEEGKFAVELAAGTYSVSVVHPDFATQTKDNLRVIPAKEVTLTLELTPAGIQLQDYVVTAPYVEGSIASTIEQQRTTSAVTQVLGADQMAASGDSDAAEALQRVSGLTIDQGKFILVRGQPYRYTFTLWNGSPLPSPEPLIRVVPLDLFPTGVLAGIEVQKSYTADKPGDFGAGLINLQTRGIPEEGFVSASVSTAYNSASTFTEGLTYNGGSLDVLGYDDGTRALPEGVQNAIAGGRSLEDLPADEKNALGQTFSNNYRLRDRLLIPDVGVSVAAGEKIDIFDDGVLGAVGSVKWSSRWRKQERIQRRFALAGEQLRLRDDFLENRTDFTSDIGALLTIKAEWENHVFSSNTFYAHQTQQRSQLTTGFVARSDNGAVRQFILSWIERQLIAQQLGGLNDFGFFKLEYRGMFAVADRSSPDRREYGYVDPEPLDDRFIVFGNSGMNREENVVDDTVLSFGVDLTVPILDAETGWVGLSAKAGAAGSFQDRDSVTRIFRWRPDDENGADITQTDPEILYDPSQSGSTLLFGDFSGSSRDDHTGFLDVIGLYGLVDLKLSDYVRVVGGLRYERAKLQVTTFQFSPDDDNAVVGEFDQKKALPSVSATWLVNEDMQVRAAYGRTTSRPSLNELSEARFFDPDSGEGFVGDSELGPVTIHGVDVRWEWYPTPTESLTFGGFFKSYDDPIERTFTQVGGTDPLGTFQNADSARVLGLELDGRFEMERVREWFGGPEFIDDLYVMGNVAVLTSKVRLSRAGVDTNPERALDGQANFALNAQAGYNGEDHDITLSFNLVGRRLHRAGIQGQPDVFLQPVPSLDINWTWRIWDGGRLRVGGSNLLNPTFTWMQGDQVWRSYKKGLTVGASFQVRLD